MLIKKVFAVILIFLSILIGLAFLRSVLGLIAHFYLNNSQVSELRYLTGKFCGLLFELMSIFYMLKYALLWLKTEGKGPETLDENFRKDIRP